MSAYISTNSKGIYILIRTSVHIAINMKEEIIWVPIYDDWADGWYPVIMEKKKNGGYTYKTTKRP